MFSSEQRERGRRRAYSLVGCGPPALGQINESTLRLTTNDTNEPGWHFPERVQLVNPVCVHIFIAAGDACVLWRFSRLCGLVRMLWVTITVAGCSVSTVSSSGFAQPCFALQLQPLHIHFACPSPISCAGQAHGLMLICLFDRLEASRLLQSG